MKKSSREKLNLFFSAFLVIAYIVCSYFFMTLASRTSNAVSLLIQVFVFVLFGLLIFYATRVGEGVAVKRFSPIVLCVLDIPALFIIIATLAPAFPLHVALASQPVVMMFACIALGYGIPYTFLSGFEVVEEPVDYDVAEELVKGGIAEELAALDEAEELNDDEVADENDVEELEAIDGAEAEDATEAEETEEQ